MNKRTLPFLGFLLLALVTVSFLLNRGLAQGVIRNTDVHLATDSATHLQGETVRFAGTLDFRTDEEVFFHQVALVVDGPGTEDLDVALPLLQGEGFDLTGISGVTGILEVVPIGFTDLVPPGGTLPEGTLPAGTLPGGTLPPITCQDGTLPSGTLPGDTLPGTLPGGTLPGGALPGGTLPGTSLPGSGQFRGIGDTGAITYAIDWTPSAVGSYQAQLAVIAVGPQGCAISRSGQVHFLVGLLPPRLADCSKSHGFWKHQFKGRGKQQIDDDTLRALLSLIRSESGIFDEAFALSTLADANAILNFNKRKGHGNSGKGHKNNGGTGSKDATASTGERKKKKKNTNGGGDTAGDSGTGSPDVTISAKFRDKALAQTLAAWLNFAAGAIERNEMVDTDGNGVADLPFGDLIAEVESILSDPNASKADLEHAKDLAEAVNEHYKNNPACDTQPGTGTGTGIDTATGMGTGTGTGTGTNSKNKDKRKGKK